MKKFFDVNLFVSLLQVLIIVGVAAMLLLMSGCEADYPHSGDTTDEFPRLSLNVINKAADSDLNVVFVPEAYTSIQMGNFLHEVSMAWDILRQVSPYSYYLDKINVYYTTELTSNSDTLGIGRTAFGLGKPKQNSAHADIAFDSIRSVSRRLPFLLEKTVLVVLANLTHPNLGYTLRTTPSAHQTIPQTVVIPSFFSNHSGPAFIHEMGHAVGLLADEYYGSEEDYVLDDQKRQSIIGYQEQGMDLNVSISPDPNVVYWREFLADDSFFPNEKMGIYEGGELYPHGVWRSTENSVMRHHFKNDSYNPISRYLISKRIEQMHSGKELTYSEWKMMDRECPTHSVDWVGITGVKTRGNNQVESWEGSFGYNDVVIVE